MVEVVSVAAMVAVAAGVAIVGLTAALDSSRRDARMQAVFSDLVRRRAVHLGISSPAEACLVVRLKSAKTFELEERTNCTDPASARPPEIKTYDVSSLSLGAGSGQTEFCVDNLARVRDCLADPVVFRDARIEIDADRTAGPDGAITWSQGGRLSATFTSSVDASAQPHLSDVSATSTPTPTRYGGYQGQPTDPQGLLE